jgi:hypothetical protein
MSDVPWSDGPKVAAVAVQLLDFIITGDLLLAPPPDRRHSKEPMLRKDAIAASVALHEVVRLVRDPHRHALHLLGHVDLVGRRCRVLLV